MSNYNFWEVFFNLSEKSGKLFIFDSVRFFIWVYFLISGVFMEIACKKRNCQTFKIKFMVSSTVLKQVEKLERRKCNCVKCGKHFCIFRFSFAFNPFPCEMSPNAFWHATFLQIDVLLNYKQWNYNLLGKVFPPLIYANNKISENVFPTFGKVPLHMS